MSQNQTAKQATREISCEELNLIVSAQISPNLDVDLNAANKLIECQRIDPTLASKLSPAMAAKFSLSPPSTVASVGVGVGVGGEREREREGKQSTQQHHQQIKQLQMASSSQPTANQALLPAAAPVSVPVPVPGALPSSTWPELVTLSNGTQLKVARTEQPIQSKLQLQLQRPHSTANSEFNVSAHSLTSTTQTESTISGQKLHAGAKVAL